MNVKEKRQGMFYVKSKCTQNTKPPFAPINPHTQMPPAPPHSIILAKTSTSKKLSSKKSLLFSSVLVRCIPTDNSDPIGKTTSIFIFYFREIGWTFTTTSYSALTWGIPVSLLLIFVFVLECRTG